jgi:hypothetical protein
LTPNRLNSGFNAVSTNFTVIVQFHKTRHLDDARSNDRLAGNL